MFGIEKYLIIANIAICVIVAGALAGYNYYLDKKQTAHLSQQYTKISNQSQRGQEAISTEISTIEKNQVILINSLVDIQNSVSINQLGDQINSASLVARINELNNNVNSLADKFKRLPKSQSCYLLN